MAVRITGGVLVRRLIRIPKTGVRPTQDRVRAALFSSLADRIPGARVLDLFAGSGALGLEAYSRGAASVCWVESDRRVLAVLKDNIRELCGPSCAKPRRRASPVGQGNVRQFCGSEADSGRGESSLRPIPETRIVADDVLRFIRRASEEMAFDIIFADPPYDRDGKWMRNILCALSAGSMVAPFGWVILEVAARSPVVAVAGWTLVKTREYGETRLCVLAKD